jgi:hypothetical protein
MKMAWEGTKGRVSREDYKTARWEEGKAEDFKTVRR